MNKKKYDPKAIALTLLTFLGSLIIAGVIRSLLPTGWVPAIKHLIFWIITLGISGPGTVFIAKNFNNRGRR